MKDKKLKIIIATGIYPPAIGGPAQYAKNVKGEFEKCGHIVKILTYKIENKLPTGIRHIWFFFKVFFALIGTDFILCLDTFSVGFPAVLAGKIFGKKTIIRTGGDFLWESYIERTNDLVLFKDFYNTRMNSFFFKEKIIFNLTKWALNNCSRLIFSTEWQKNIFIQAYSLNEKKIDIVENYYGPKEEASIPVKKNFIAGTRLLKWKNMHLLKDIFKKDIIKDEGLIYDDENMEYKCFMEKIKGCYAVILPSLGDISPNMILDAIRFNKPFILTKETGLYDKLKDIGIFIDPENIDDITGKILFLADECNYDLYKRKIELFSFKHTWNDICNEILSVFYKIK